MELTKVVSSAVLLLSVALSGCSSILGIEEKQLTSGDAPTDCPLVMGGLPAVRVMNAIPDSAALDLCHKVAGIAGYGKTWFGTNRKACGEGVAYTQFTRDLALEEGSYDFKLVPAGSGCDADGIETSGVSVEANSSITLMAYGATFGTAQISTLPNRTEATTGQPVRFVHALNNAGLLDAGLVSASTPTTLGTIIYRDIEYGRASPHSDGDSLAEFDDVDEFGYNVQGGPGMPTFDLNFGVQLATLGTVMLRAPIPVTPGHAYSVFALGTNGVSKPRPKIWSCDETPYTGLFLTCGNPSKISIEVFDPNVTDAFTSSVAERIGPAVKAILSESTDLLCVTELYDPAVVEQLRNGGPSVFQSVRFSNDIPAERTMALTATPEGTQPDYPEIACPDDLAAGLAEWLECAKQTPGCTTPNPANPDETMLAYPGEIAMGCMFTCGATGAYKVMLEDIQSGRRPESGPCYWCGVTHLASYESFESTLQQCTTPVPVAQQSHMAFGGSSGLAVFSREAELGDAELVLLPSSGWQRAAMRVPVTLKNGAVFDYWCTSVRFPNTEDALSYAGPYGEWGTMGAAQEQGLEVATAVTVIDERAKATGVPAIVGIVAHAGPGYDDPTTHQQVVYPFLADEIFSLMGAWSELVAPNYTPACTFCGDKETNPLNDYGKEYRIWTTHLFGLGVAPSDVESTTRTFMDATVSLTDADGIGFKAPISQHFGLRSVVKMTQ